MQNILRKHILPIAGMFIVFATIILFVGLSLANRESETSLLTIQTIVLSIQVPIFVAAASALIQNLRAANAKIKLDFGVVSGVRAASEVEDKPFSPVATAENGHFTLLFRNVGDQALTGLVFRIYMKGENGIPIRISGLGEVHIKPETEYRSLKTTEEFDYFAPNVIMPLSLRVIDNILAGRPQMICTLRVQIIKSTLSNVPPPFEAKITLLAQPPADFNFIY